MSALIVSSQVSDVPVQSPLQPVNDEPGAGSALSVTVSVVAKYAVHVDPRGRGGARRRLGGRRRSGDDQRAGVASTPTAKDSSDRLVVEHATERQPTRRRPAGRVASVCLAPMGGAPCENTRGKDKVL
jgi:hypothetical protein